MPPGLPLRWLYLDLNSYFASVEQQEQPELRGRPVAVAPVESPSGTIIAASYDAKAYGVRTGHKVREAKALCPHLLLTPARHDLYVDYHHRVLAEVERHVPVDHVCSIDEVACRLLDNENSPEAAADLGRRIKAGIRAKVGQHLRCSVGVAPNRLIAKIACDMEKPDGLTVITAPELPQRLFCLSLKDIPGVGPRMEARLHAHGIRSIAELCARQPGEAGAAWGAVLGARLWHRLHGSDFADEPQKSKSIGHSHVLAPQKRDPELVRQVARRLLLKAAARARRGGWVARRLSLSARLEGGGDWRREVKVAPTADSFPLVAVLDGLWPGLERALRDRRERVRTIGVTLLDIGLADTDQLSLFAALPTADPLGRAARTPGLSAALDRVNARFGRNAATLGPLTGGRADQVGAKIAFNRIPDRADFSG